MADIENTPIQPGSTQPGKPGPKKELSMEKRLLLAFLLMGLVLFVSPYIYKAPTPAKPVTPPAASQPAQAKKPVPAAVKQTAPVPEEAIPGQIQAGGEQEFIVDTEFYRIRFSNRCAVATSWVVKKYPDHA